MDAAVAYGVVTKASPAEFERAQRRGNRRIPKTPAIYGVVTKALPAELERAQRRADERDRQRKSPKNPFLR